MSRCTLDPDVQTQLSHTGLSPSLAGFPKTVLLTVDVTFAVLTPECTHSGLGSSGFARRYSRNRCFFLFLRLLRCFSSPGSRPVTMDSLQVTWSLSMSIPQSEPRHARTSVWALPVSLAATPGIDVSFSSSGYLDVSVHRVPFRTLWIGVRMTGVLPAGFPHSDICGSKIICISPQLFAAYHVFLRLLVPRHPPCALFCLIICNIFACECITYAHASRQRTFMHVLLSCHSVGNFH